MARFLTTAALLLCAAASLDGQRSSFRFYGQSEGLDNLNPLCLLQDRSGFLWVGTENGLYRYGGRRFEAFTLASGLPNPTVTALVESGDGALWVGTAAGLARYSGGRFSVAPVGAVERDGLLEYPGGRLLVLTPQGLVAGYPDASQPAGVRFLAPVRPAGSAAPHAAVIDSEGAVWLAAANLLGRIRPETAGRLFTRAEATVTAEPWSPAQGVPSDRWDALRSGPRGEVYARSRTKLLVRQARAASFSMVEDAPPATAPRGLLDLDRQGRLWLKNGSTVAILMGPQWVAIGAEQGLPSVVQRVFEDREGSVWLGVEGIGLARWIGFGQWQGWTRDDGLPHSGVRVLTRDTGGTLWAGTDLGLAYLPPGGRRWHAWPLGPLAEEPVVALAATPDKILWAATASGLYRIDLVERLAHRLDAGSGLPDQAGVRALLADRQGRLWAGSRRGLWRLEPGRGRLFVREELDTVSVDEVLQLAADPSGRLWVGTRHGLLANNNDGPGWRRFTVDDGLRSDLVARLAARGRGELWIGYLDAPGLSRLQADAKGSWHVEGRAPAAGLHSDRAQSLAADGEGRIWIGTDNGVDVTDGRRWRHFSRGDGLLFNYTYENALRVDPDGAVLIGTSHGLSRFSPPAELFGPSGAAGPPVVVTQARLGGRPAEFVQASEARLEPVRGGEPALEVSFAAMTFLNEEAVRFRYRMSGLGSDWTYGSSGDARYAGLPPGHYRFEVAAQNARGQWSPQPATLVFDVLPPWWSTWWFQLLLAAAAIALIRRYWGSRIRRLLDVQRRLEAAVEARTAELMREKTRVERQKMEIEILLDQARLSERGKSQFLANMSHEIRTPLNGILGMTELAIDTELPDKQREYLRLTRDSAQTLLGIVNGILDFSKIEAGRLTLEKHPFRVRDLVAEAVHNVAVRARRKGLALDSTVEDEVPMWVAGDSSRLRQILLNLLDNAIKFTDAGSVHVRVSREKVPEGHLHFTVHDTGIGIPLEKRGLVFESFRQADESTTRRFGGTGLGLAISRQLAEMMGGRLWVDSEMGQGSTFHVTVRCEAVAAAVAALEAPAPSQIVLAPRPARILLAEDNAVNQKVMLGLLEKRGYDVVVAEDGARALELIETAKFDLVLMDVQMPVMSGTEATVRLRQIEKSSGRHLPVIAITAGAMAGDRERCLHAGMDDYLSKPLQVAELFEKIERAIG